MDGTQEPPRPSPLPEGLASWTQWNALAALLGVAASLTWLSVVPALSVAALSLCWLLLRRGPEPAGVANLITAARLALFAAVIVSNPPGSLVALTTLAVWVLDGIDGWVARRRGEASAFGAQFDMETDAYVVLALATYLVVERGFGAWVIATGALRYFYVIARWLAGPRAISERRSSLGRWVYSLALGSLALACIPMLGSAAGPLLAIALAALIISFAPDFAALRR